MKNLFTVPGARALGIISTLAFVACGGFPTEIATVHTAGDTTTPVTTPAPEEPTEGPMEELLVYCADSDADGYGNPWACELWPEGDQPAGYVENDDDCNDSNPGVNPGAVEVENGMDDDCDGSVDEGLTASDPTDPVDDPTDPVDPPFVDEDGDGYGLAPYDCDDGDSSVYPGADEICDGVDNDCDGLADDADPGSEEECDDTPAPADDFVEVCVTEVVGTNYDLSVRNDTTGDNTLWFTGTTLLTEVDADDCAVFTAESGDRLEFNGYADDSELWGEYLVGLCSGDAGDWVVNVAGTCAVIGLEVDGMVVNTFSGYDLTYTVP
ncbi:MAG: putative metal-binding motif-containing protein [Patescibacteria group bacterium]